MKDIQLTQGKVAVVDDDDYLYLSRFKWQASLFGRIYYAQRCTRERTVERMHRTILSTMVGRTLKRTEQTDHVNGDGLDNRRSNLRVASPSQNLHNYHRRSSKASSQYLGVCWDKKNKKWCARIRANGKKVHLGRHATERAAMLAREAFIADHPELNARSNLPVSP